MAKHHPAKWFRHGNTADGASAYRALSAAPTLITDGVPVPPDRRDELVKVDLSYEAAGAASFDVVVWAYKPAVCIEIAGVETAIVGARGPGWTNIGTVSVSGTPGAGQLRESHQMHGISGFTRIAFQTTNLVGAPTIWTDAGFSMPEEE
jgi:hypothetical protein